MKIKALKSFSGALTMTVGEVREYGNEEILNDLMRAGYIEEVRPRKPSRKAVTPHESQRTDG